MREFLNRLRRRPATQSATPSDGFAATRYHLAQQYLHGSGLEIGALHMPLAVPDSARVKYVDRMPVEQLREQYPELSELPLVPLDIVDDGERLEAIEPASQDFVIANHFIEHTEDPISTLNTFLRVLKEGGILYLAVPDKRYTFDYDRQVTPISHLLEDHRDGPQRSRRQHFVEWVTEVEKYTNGQEQRVEHLLEINYSIHFHVWTNADFAELIAYCSKELELPIELEAMQRNDHEFICVLRKQSEPVERPAGLTRARAGEGVS